MGNAKKSPDKNVIPFANNEKAVPALAPRSLQEAVHFAELLSKSTFIPDTYRNKEGDVLAAVIMGAELGLGPMQSLQNIAVINGRPCVWGDALLALVYNSPLCEYVREEFDEKNAVAVCIAKRKGRDEIIRTFSWKDACNAGLHNKKGPWQNYRQRMLQQRARGFALRDAFPDVLRGLITREEAADYDEAPPKQNPPPQKNQGQAPAAKDQDVIDAEFEEKKQDGPPTVDDCLSGIANTRTIKELEKHAETHSDLWVDIFGEGSNELTMLRAAYSQQKQRIHQRGTK